MIPEPYHAVVRVLPEPALLLSADGDILGANPAAADLLGPPVRELVGRNLSAFVEEDGARVTDYLGRCARSGEVVLGAVHLRTAGGAEQGEEGRAFRCEGAVLRPAAAGTACVLFLRLKPRESASRRFHLLNRKIEELGREIHERRRVEQELRAVQGELEAHVAARTEALMRANEALRRSNEALQNFASIASHDLREPLRKVISFGDLLRESLADRLDDESRHILARMQSGAHRMHTFIVNLLEYSRVTAQPGRFERLALDAVLRDVLTDLDVRIRETGARIETADLPVIEADRGQMYQLFQNLVANALKFHRKGESPVVRVVGRPAEGAAGRRCEIRVEDRGIGFDAADAERIFDVFQRLHPRTAYEGTGIGLAICKRIVERHGGTICAESRPGQGAVFQITLPETQGEESAKDEDRSAK